MQLHGVPTGAEYDHVPRLNQDPTLQRCYDRYGRTVFRLQDGTRVEHTLVNGNIHIFLRLDKCILSVVQPNPDPDKMRHIIHFNHDETDCSLSNMCWATREQKRDYYKATLDLLTDPDYLKHRRFARFTRFRMRRYRSAQDEVRRFGRVITRPWYDYRT